MVYNLSFKQSLRVFENYFSNQHSKVLSIITSICLKIVYAAVVLLLCGFGCKLNVLKGHKLCILFSIDDIGALIKGFMYPRYTFTNLDVLKPNF